MTKNTISGGIFLLFSLLYIYWGMKIPPSPYTNEAVGPRVFPLTIGVLLALASIALIILGLLNARQTKVTNEPDQLSQNEDDLKMGAHESNEEDELEDQAQDSKKTFVILGLLLCYVLLFVPLGYILSTSLFILGLSIYLDRKHWIRNIVYAIVFPSVIFILFNNVLSVYLPTGPLG